MCFDNNMILMKMVSCIGSELMLSKHFAFRFCLLRNFKEYIFIAMFYP